MCVYKGMVMMVTMVVVVVVVVSLLLLAGFGVCFRARLLTLCSDAIPDIKMYYGFLSCCSNG